VWCLIKQKDSVTFTIHALGALEKKVLTRIFGPEEVRDARERLL
jgi:hypothetical protein